MEGGRMLRNSQIIVLGVCIAVATIVSSVILSQGFMKVMKFTREQITVTGSATKEIKSDYIVWKGTITRRAGPYPLHQQAHRPVATCPGSRGRSESVV